MYAGVARVDITPPVGISMVGYYIREGVSTGIERPLTATALVLTDGETKVVIVACDLLFIQNPDAADVRHRIAAATGTRAECVLLNFSHTHCGPTLPGFMWQEDDQRQLQAEYLANLKAQLIVVAAAANANLQPVRVGSGSGSANIGINRREKDENGKVFLGENPDGPIDPEVIVIRVDYLDGRPLAMLYSHGCHTVTMGPKCLKLSPDFIGPAREHIETATGALSLFLQGAAGNINPMTGIGSREDDSENMRRLGTILGAEVVKTMMQIRTHERRGPRVFLSSLAKVSLYPYIPIKPGEADRVQVLTESIDLPLLPLPSLEEARRILVDRTQKWDKAKVENASPGVLTVLRRFYDWAQLLHRTVESGRKEATIPLELQAIRINDLAIVAVPGETLVELGLAVKKAALFAKTVFLGYSNGCIGYISPADAYPQGGWSPWETYAIPDMLFQSYQLPMALSPECGQMVVDRAVELSRRLVTAAKSQTAPEKL
jgi:neutral ceramidase